RLAANRQPYRRQESAERSAQVAQPIPAVGTAADSQPIARQPAAPPAQAVGNGGGARALPPADYLDKLDNALANLPAARAEAREPSPGPAVEDASMPPAAPAESAPVQENAWDLALGHEAEVSSNPPPAKASAAPPPGVPPRRSGP